MLTCVTGFVQVGSAVYACSCLGPRSLEDELARATVVFRGVVVEVDQRPVWWGNVQRLAFCGIQRVVGDRGFLECLVNYEHLDPIATFRLRKVWKGAVGPEVTVGTPPSCAVRWRVGDEWVVYGDGEDALYTTICTRSRRGDEVAAESAQLDIAVADRE